MPIRDTRHNVAAEWLIVRYAPVGLFSLKSSLATSSVGKTLLVPTPYAIKMALVDAGFRAHYSYEECSRLLRALSTIDVRISPPARAVVTHTFTKVRQERKKRDPLRPYVDSIAYREYVYFGGAWRLAFGIGADNPARGEVLRLAPHVNYLGKRGSFIQYDGAETTSVLDAGFSQPLQSGCNWVLPKRSHVAQLDDFGPEADLDAMSSYSDRRVERDKHRKFVVTVVPIGIVNTGPGFSEYRS